LAVRAQPSLSLTGAQVLTRPDCWRHPDLGVAEFLGTEYLNTLGIVSDTKFATEHHRKIFQRCF
jgi:hypothetical protein